MKAFRGILISIIIVLSIVMIFGLNNVKEEGLVEYQIEGETFDAATSQPLKGVEVMILLDKWPTEDPKRLERLFAAYSSRWNGKFSGKNMGLSDGKGEYVSRGSQKYSRQYKTLFGIRRKTKQPFEKAWVVYQKPGYNTAIEEFPTKEWSVDGAANSLPDVYLEKLTEKS